MSRQEEFDYLFKIVIIGDSGVGKTNLLGRFVDDSFSMDSKPTIGVEFATKTLLVQNRTIKNQIWDTAGQQRFRAITNAYYRGAQGAIVVYDLTKSKTFENIGKWLAQLRENADPDITIMLLGNKTDLEERAVKIEEVEEYVASNKLLYIETSAQSGENVNEAFNSLIKDIYNKVKVIPEQKKTDTPVKPNSESEKKEQEKTKGNLAQNKQKNIVLDEHSNKKQGKKPENKKCCG